jgi:hypothetical protein
MTKHKTTDIEPKKRRGVRLNKPCDVKRLLNRCINETLYGHMETDTLRAVSYSCQCILKVFEISEIEQRLIELESTINAK